MLDERGGVDMAKGIGAYPECEICGEHSGVVSKQEARDIEMREIHDRIEKTVTANAFYWIMGALISVMGSVAILYAAGMDTQLDTTRSSVENSLSAIKVQNERLLEKIDKLSDKVTSIQIDVEKTKAVLDQNRHDIDNYTRGRR